MLSRHCKRWFFNQAVVYLIFLGTKFGVSEVAGTKTCDWIWCVSFVLGCGFLLFWLDILSWLKSKLCWCIFWGCHLGSAVVTKFDQLKKFPETCFDYHPCCFFAVSTDLCSEIEVPWSLPRSRPGLWQSEGFLKLQNWHLWKPMFPDWPCRHDVHVSSCMSFYVAHFHDCNGRARADSGIATCHHAE